MTLPSKLTPQENEALLKEVALQIEDIRKQYRLCYLEPRDYEGVIDSIYEYLGKNGVYNNE